MRSAVPQQLTENARRLIPAAALAFLALLAVVNLMPGRPLERPVQAKEMASGPVAFGEQFTSAETRRWTSVPQGTQVLNGVTFVCQGAVRTAGLHAARDRKHYPGAVMGIPVERKGGRIHLLHAAENCGGIQKGSPYGRLRFHFDNGESRDFFLCFSVHGRDWYQSPRERDGSVSDPHTEAAWGVPRKDGVTIRLFHTVVENPFPEQMITTMDAISPLDSGNLLLFGVSVTSDTTKPGAMTGPPPDERAALTISVRDRNGVAATNVSLRFEVRAGNSFVRFAAWPVDGKGFTTFDFPKRGITELHYATTDAEGAAMEILQRPAGGWPDLQHIEALTGAMKTGDTP